MQASPLRIAIIGTRGIPARYGGFETVVQELAPRLVERGHEVTVYGRRPSGPGDAVNEFRGVRLIHTPAVAKRSLEQVSHEVTSIVDSLRREFDLYLFMGYRGAPLYVILRALGRPVVVNTDGIEWRRRKWNRIGRTYLRMAEWLVARIAASELIVDSRAIGTFLEQQYGRASTYLPYGAYVRDQSALRPEVLRRFGLRPGDYYLVACRIEPENNVDVIVRGFIASQSKRELIVVGSMNYATPFWERLQQLAARSRVRFIGSVYGAGELDSLRLGSYAFLHGHEVGGTNPTLLEAMACGSVPLALDNPFNRETIADTGRFWRKDGKSLSDLVRWADANPAILDELRARGRRRVAESYSWEASADAYDAFVRRIVARRGVARGAEGRR